MLEKIIETARKAGDAILEYYSEDIEVFDKEDDSPLTKADLAAHHIIVDELKRSGNSGDLGRVGSAGI